MIDAYGQRKRFEAGLLASFFAVPAKPAGGKIGSDDMLRLMGVQL